VNQFDTGALAEMSRVNRLEYDGTSTNMNANQVIANRALELMGHQKGEYKDCDPHDHVNASQSTNDFYPTARHVGTALGNVDLINARPARLTSRAVDVKRSRLARWLAVLGVRAPFP